MLGQIVHYVFHSGAERAALIVRAEGDVCNLLVFMDGLNDSQLANGADGAQMGNNLWITSVPQSEKTHAPHTWHWIDDSRVLTTQDLALALAKAGI